MKKVYTTIILFVSLFFFCCNNASAATYNATIDENSMSFINDDFFKIKELALKYHEDNNFNYYLISYNSSDNLYRVYFFNEVTNYYVSRTGSGFYINMSIGSAIYHRLVDGALSNTKYSSSIFSTTLNIDSTTNIMSFSGYLYSNYDIIENSTDTFIISYNDFIYDSSQNEIFPSLYDIYLSVNNINPVEPDIHKEEKEILSNFYTLVIEKINLLANSIINNYIYLTVIGIFILIFVICLIRRYLL